jgi:hypothetical protein
LTGLDESAQRLQVRLAVLGDEEGQPLAHQGGQGEGTQLSADARPLGTFAKLPSDQRNGETTRSPTLSVRTSSPTSSTTPMNSCPMRRPSSSGSIDLYGQRSLPQMAARVTRTSALVYSIRWASGTSSTRTSPAPYMRVARIAVTSGARWADHRLAVSDAGYASGVELRCSPGRAVFKRRTGRDMESSSGQEILTGTRVRVS